MSESRSLHGYLCRLEPGFGFGFVAGCCLDVLFVNVQKNKTNGNK